MWTRFSDKEPEKIVNKLYIFAGRWGPNLVNSGGSPEQAMVSWTSTMSNGKGFTWFIANTFNRLQDMNVQWTHWKEIDEYPDDL